MSSELAEDEGELTDQWQLDFWPVGSSTDAVKAVRVRVGYVAVVKVLVSTAAVPAMNR